MIDEVDGVTQALPVHSDSPIRRRFASAERTYSLMLSRDLLGDWVLMQTWANRINNHGGGKSRAVDSFEAGLAALTALGRIREERGYRLVD